MSYAGDPRIGTELAGFRIEALIGRGGMGVVYLAEQLRYNRKVALKILAPELASDSSFRERFEQEWRTAARLEHPNIVPVYEAGEADGVLYLAMRYVEGIDLGGLLGRAERLAPARALGIVGQVGRALDAAHAQGLVHRDVKPGNILIASGPGDEGEHVYLTDFGVAKQAHTQTGLTRTGLFIGTVDYAAPEQIEGKQLDGRTDLYALGCVLYQCLTGVLPYEKDSEVAMLYAHLREPPPSLKARRPELPDALDAVVARALAKNPDDRYATCRGFLDEARRAAGLTPGAGRTVLDVAATPTVQSPDARTVVAGAATEQGGGAKAPPPRAPWWRSRWALVALAAVVIAGAGAGVGIGLGGGGGEVLPPLGSTGAQEEGDTTDTVDTDAGDTGASGETTDAGETDPPPPAPGAQGAVAFSSQRDGDFDLYAMYPDGSGRMRLTNDPGVEANPGWSPDGTEIVYDSDADGDYDIYRLPIAGGTPWNLTDNVADDFQAAWSPDGTRIAFTRRSGDEDSELFVMNADGTGVTQLTDNGTDDSTPGWSPDSTQIAYQTYDGADWEIGLANADGTGLSMLTDNDANDLTPAWFGDRLAFSSDRGSANYDIWTMGDDGSGPVRLASSAGEDSVPKWSPDGSRIFFQTDRGGDFEIYAMNADGTAQTQLTDDETPDFDLETASSPVTLPEPDGSLGFLTDSSAYPTRKEAILLSHVPLPTRETCERESRELIAGAAIAGVFCSSKNGTIGVYYDLFATQQAMNRSYNRIRSSWGVARDSPAACNSNENSEGNWTSGDVNKGRLACFFQTGGNGLATILWTYDDAKIVTVAAGPGKNRKALYTWWRSSSSGPTG